MDKPWKKAERRWARFLGGQRHASQGVQHVDVSTPHLAVEHKYRKFTDYSAEFRKAIAQHDHNKVCHDDKFPLICFTFYQGKGKANRHFIMAEIDNMDKKTIEDFLEELLARVRGVLPTETTEKGIKIINLRDLGESA